MSLDSEGTIESEMGLSPSDARRLGSDAFVFGFPLLTTMATMRREINVATAGSGRAPLNQFAHLEGFPNPAFKAIVGANAHTLYSQAWLDLSAEPQLLTLPDTGGRSYLMPLIDAWGDAFTCFGPRTVGTDGGTYALVGPGWGGPLPDGVRRIDAPTNVAWTIAHTHASGRDDFGFARAIQQGLKLTPLGSYRGPCVPPVEALGRKLDLRPSPRHTLAGTKTREFFGELAREMEANPPAGGDRPMLDRLAVIGLRPGRPFAWGNLPGGIREALRAGVEEGRTAIATPPPQRLKNGWHSLRERRGGYGTDYLRRAQIAHLALGIARPEDALFPIAATDGGGMHLHGDHRYTLRFEPDGLPPVGALWSLALYDLDQLPVANSIDRYALGDRDALELDSKGSLEISIQSNRPDGSDANWLPAPEDGFNLMLHMYWPSRRVLDGKWIVPPVRRID